MKELCKKRTRQSEKTSRNLKGFHDELNVEQKQRPVLNDFEIIVFGKSQDRPEYGGKDIWEQPEQVVGLKYSPFYIDSCHIIKV